MTAADGVVALNSASPAANADAVGDKAVREHGKVRLRIIAMVVSIILAHAFVALALHYTWMDDDNNFHTSYLSFGAAILCFVVFSVCVGMR
ncbi:hypothetical protein [Acidomonas methanolica]|uniref:Uncharacterized protein n=1 Tax=Acidomonas methanolica NBRC 104435 TaxID=1231351 RepID=A0A023D2I6_ACIMT|nr:hypothetical protein [Acidomonas methanolica]MBU2653548.1 hypothetical protein [Acidomonas methanolica]TCS31498.1 hypothetical protein EDC31_10247 [Acidomonas methanolica]GAJ28279.1 hypothetical protein Amme_018_004 [Acidomonas methanolica NBRC 104435]GBQ52754.1 hypothetical protein AA0498_1800 [Acidomonas methanolica]GEK97918.1 hypothetical protein AME01nite_04170 [Acidomonas methanolica NBRC 104435]